MPTAVMTDAPSPKAIRTALSRIEGPGLARFYREALDRAGMDGVVVATGWVVALAAGLEPRNASNQFAKLVVLGLAVKVGHGRYRVFRAGR